MSKQLTERQDDPLPRRILRRISRKPIHVKRFEAHPHGMRRIGQTAVGQRVTKQQIAVLIMDSRNGHRQLRQNSKPDADDDEEKGDDRQRLALRQTGKKGLDGVEHSCCQPRQKNCKKQEVKSDSKDHAERVRHAHQQNVNEVTHLGCEFSALDCGTYGAEWKVGYFALPLKSSPHSVIVAGACRQCRWFGVHRFAARQGNVSQLAGIGPCFRLSAAGEF